MVTTKQRREIKKRMQKIKDAKNDGADKATIKKRTQELYKYLVAEGIVLPPDE